MTDQKNNKSGLDSTKLTRLEKHIDDELSNIKKEVDDLYTTVYKGNGTPSLLTRVTSVEGKLRGLRETMDEKISHLSRENALKFDALHQKLESKFGRLEGWIETKLSGIEHMLRGITERKNTENAGKWQLKAAFIMAGAAIIGAVITYFNN